MELDEILRKMISGDIEQFQPLPRGLLLQYRQPNESKPNHRLLCYRKNTTIPSTNEFAIIRRELEKLVDGEIELGEPQEFGGGRWGRIFSWPAQGMVQGVLPLEVDDERPH